MLCFFSVGQGRSAQDQPYLPRVHPQGYADVSTAQGSRAGEGAQGQEGGQESGTGLTGSRTQARLSLKVYSTVSVLMMVQHEPSFSSSRLASFGQGDACGECQTHCSGDGGEWGWDAWLCPQRLGSSM